MSIWNKQNVVLCPEKRVLNMAEHEAREKSLPPMNLKMPPLLLNENAVE